MLVRTLQTNLYINNRLIQKGFSHIVANSINSIGKTASIQIAYPLYGNPYNFKENDVCRIEMINDYSKAEIFNGFIDSIIDEKKSKSISISALEKIMEPDIYNETFQDTTLANIMQNLGKIKVVGFSQKLKQCILEGKRTESFTRIIQNFEEMIKQPIYYSVYDNSLIVRKSMVIDNSKTFNLDNYSYFSENNIICVPILNAQVGDKILIENNLVVIKSLTTSKSSQSIQVEELT